jgi:glycerol-3-phosphate acyltransferase PlsX
MRIAVDAMGGDHAPDRNVAGAVEAAASSGGRYEVVLVGDRPTLEERFTKLIKGLPIEIVHADEVVAMNESPSVALRSKRDSSITIAMELHGRGEVDGVVSPGNTGAAMAAALHGLGPLPGVSRPAIASFFPSAVSPVLLLDVGANVECKPSNLTEFGLMGSVYVQYVLGIENPTVGLLSIGEESKKGTEVIVAAHRELLNSNLNFVGNVQGGDILTSEIDVVVCDGFTGNTILKFSEGVTSLLTAGIRRGLSKSPPAKLGALLMSPVLMDVKKELSYEEYGGAPMLGIDGTLVICHGRSTVKAIRNAVEAASRMIEEGINEQIKARLDKIHAANIQ